MQVAPANAAGASGPAFDTSKHPSGIIPQLQNMVATVNLGCKLDLKQIALHARNSEYNPKVSFEAQWAFDSSCNSVHGSGAAHTPFGAYFYTSCSQRFAAVIMRIKEPKTTALVFASGKMVCTGARSEDDATLAARKVNPLLNHCRSPQDLVGSLEEVDLSSIV